MMGSLFVDRVNQVECSPREVSLIGIRIDPNGEEFGPKISGAGFVEAQIAGVVGIAVSEIEVLVDKTLRRIGVGIHDNRRIMNGAGFWRGGDLGGGDCRDDGEK